MHSDSVKRLAEIHIAESRKYALRLFAFTSSVFPSEWGSTWSEIITADLLEFAFHARKVNELCRLQDEKFPSIGTLLIKISEGDPGNWEANYQYALNAFVHLNDYKIGHAHADHRAIFIGSEASLQATYVKIKTDKFSEKTISICGLVFCFLNSVVPLLRRRFPELRF
ncbi:hypothetical protein CXL00_07025 [Stutzerimonas stutzeri]|uniref:Uncharacterized protein n=1 Tax=Stutzerimonas stutzeri TaxID=316 RepID=A0A2N8SWY0_STUST|nr:hypothetical protein CXL00_07025 [Stutzerimonas stutzeri]